VNTKSTEIILHVPGLNS